MIREQRRDIVSGVVSAGVLSALLVAPPVMLVAHVGWPLPTDLPSPGQVTRALTIGIEDGVIVKSVAVLTWLAWTQVVLCVALEVAGVVRGRVHDDRFVVPGVRAAIGRLVASTTVALSSLGSGSALGVAVLPVLPAVELVGAPMSPTPRGVSAPALPASTSIQADVAVNHRVVAAERHDSFWAIAERSLGDGIRWREIRDLNVGRTMPDGTRIAPTTDQVRSGWQLLVPGVDGTAAVASSAAPAQPPAPTSPSAAPADEVTVEVGDNFWSLAEEHLQATLGRPVTDAEVAPHWLRLVDANRDRLAPPHDPNLIYPGQSFALPGPTLEAPTPTVPTRPAPAPAIPASIPTSVPAPIPTEPSAADQDCPEPVPMHPDAEVRPEAEAPEQPQLDPTDASRPAPGSDDGVSEVVAIGGAMSLAIAVGVTQAVRLRRRRQRHDGQSREAGPTDVDRRTHQEVVATADVDRVGLLHIALEQLAADIADADLPCRPKVVQQGRAHVDVLLDRPTMPAAGGWAAEASGHIWSRDPGAIAHEVVLAADHPAPTPLLVSLGVPEQDSQLYLDLEAAGVLTLVGDEDVALGVARGLVTDLAHSPLASGAQILVLGALGASVAVLDRVATAASWPEVTDDVVAWARQSRDALAGNGWVSPFAARGTGAHHDALAPIVVVATESPPPEVAEAVLAAGASSVALVIAGGEPAAGSTVVTCSRDELRIVGLDLTCRPQPLTPEVLSALVDLLDVAAAPPEPMELLPDEPLEDDLTDEPAPDYEDPPIGVLVRVLGDISVDRPDEPLTAKQAAVVAYIALHGTVSADALEDAVWATSATGSHRKRLANTISDCRRLLGPDYLPVAVDGRYTAGPGLVSDAELFERRLRAGAALPTDEAAVVLQGALDLVTGKVFTYRSADRASYTWVDVENWVSLWEPKVTGVAQHLAELYLDLGEPRQAIAVAQHALRIVPTDTGATEALMRAHAANHDQVAVRRVYEAHVRALDQLDLDEPAESTTKLYDELRHPPGEGDAGS